MSTEAKGTTGRQSSASSSSEAGSAPGQRNQLRQGGLTASEIMTVLAMGLGFSITGADPTILSSNVTAVQQGVGVSTASMSFLASLATLTLAATILGAGALGDVLGKRRMFMVGLVGSAVFGVLAAAAPNSAVLGVARALSGVSFAFLLGLSLAIVTSTFPAEQRARVIGLYLAAAFLTTAPQPAIGGLLVEHVSWRAGFLVATVVALVTLFITWRYVPDLPGTPGRSIDVVGIGLAAVMLVGLVYGISRLGDAGGAAAIVPIVVGLLAGVGFVLWERRQTQPALDLRLFTIGPFNSALAAGAVFNLFTAGATILMTYYLVAVRGEPTAVFGLLLLPASLLQAAAATFGGHTITALGDRAVMILGLALLLVSTLLFSTLSATAPLVLLFLVLALSSVGNAFIQTPQSNVLMSFAPRELAGAVASVKSGIGQTFYSLGPVLYTLLGAALFTPQATATLRANGVSADQLREALQPTGAGSADSIGGTGVLDVSQAQHIAGLVRDELLSAMHTTALIVGIVPVMGIALAFLLLPRRLPPPADAAATSGASSAGQPADTTADRGTANSGTAKAGHGGEPTPRPGGRTEDNGTAGVDPPDRGR